MPDLPPNGGFIFVCYLIFIMSIKILATLVKPCKGNRLSSWTFFNDNESYYATNDQDKRINCSGVQDARNFYTKMLSYGFHKPETILMTQDIPVTPIDPDYVKNLQAKFKEQFPNGKPKCDSLNGDPIMSWC